MDAWQGPRFQKRRCSYGPDQGDMLAHPGLATPRPRHHLPKALRPAEGNGPQPQTLLASLFPALRASPCRLSPLSPQQNPVAAPPFTIFSFTISWDGVQGSRAFSSISTLWHPVMGLYHFQTT